MFDQTRMKKILNAMAAFTGGVVAGSAVAVLMRSAWYYESPVLPLLGALAAIAAGAAAACFLKLVTPVLLMILSGGCVLLLWKDYPDAAAVLAMLFSGLLIGGGFSGRSFLAGIAVSAVPGAALIWQDIRLLWVLWGWGMVVPAVWLARSEFRYFRTWLAAAFIAAFFFLPVDRFHGPLFPPGGALPALLLPESENIRIGYVAEAGKGRAVISGYWEQFPFVEKVVCAENFAELTAEEQPFDLIVFDRITVHSLPAERVLWKQAWEKLSEKGALVILRRAHSPEWKEKTGIVLPGTSGYYMAFLKGGGDGNLSGMDKRLQRHLKNSGMGSSFMPPGVFKALFYEDVHAGEEPSDSIALKRWVNGICGAAALAAAVWVIFLFFSAGKDGSVWGNGCWYGILTALILHLTAPWEVVHPLSWYWLPLLFFAGVSMDIGSERFARVLLGISGVVPFLLLFPLENWSVWCVAGFSGVCCAVIQSTLLKREPAAHRGLFFKYAAGCFCGALILNGAVLFIPGYVTAVLILLAVSRGVALFRF